MVVVLKLTPRGGNAHGGGFKTNFEARNYQGGGLYSNYFPENYQLVKPVGYAGRVFIHCHSWYFIFIEFFEQPLLTELGP